jgi:prevent-host-death family protein
MTTTVEKPDLYAPAYRTLYAAPMVKRVLVGIQELRIKLRQRVDATIAGEHTVFTRHGKPVVVLVPIEWYRDAAKAMKDPTDI